MRAWSPSDTGPPTTRSWSTPTISSSSTRWPGSMTSPSRTAPRFRPTGSASSRESMSPWRFQATAVMKPSAAIRAIGHTWPKSACGPAAAIAAAKRLRGPGVALPQGGLGAAGISRQGHLPGHGARFGRRVHAQCLHSPARGAPEALFREHAQRLGRISGGRHLPQARGARADRRSLVDGAVSRLQDLPGRRHQHQGRPCEHGALAGGSRAADGPRAHRVGGQAFTPGEGPWRGGEIPAQARPEPCCRTMCCTGARWASPCPWHGGSAARCARACANRCWEGR